MHNKKKQNNYTQSTNSGIIAALKKLVKRQSFPVDKPYIPDPNRNCNNPPFNFEGDMSEVEADIQNLHGTAITFGTQKSIQIDDLGRGKELKQTANYIIGNGKRISNIEEVWGICRICEENASQHFQEGKITIEQAQLKSLFDVKSARQCIICGIYTCSLHCRPIQTSEGVSDVCVMCEKEISRQQKRKKIIEFLLSPFMESEKPEDNDKC